MHRSRPKRSRRGSKAPGAERISDPLHPVCMIYYNTHIYIYIYDAYTYIYICIMLVQIQLKLNTRLCKYMHVYSSIRFIVMIVFLQTINLSLHLSIDLSIYRTR
jgi:hypothetical protein